MYRVQLDRGKCIGCLACTRCEDFTCGRDFKAVAFQAKVNDIGCNRKAADLCPVGAILVLPVTPRSPQLQSKGEKIHE